ncbi:MAG: citramalate synthase [Coriobacteriales bacterium]|jgi:2-isopropylmalate synthase|nr:citramalate synthase [Coriobacteriales bacterium]
MEITLYDTTLRDGAQRDDASLSVADKLRIAARLDDFGVQYIEAGFPASNPRDAEFFSQVASGAITLQNAKLVAFGMTAHKGESADKDEGLHVLANCPASSVCIVGKTSTIHVENTLRVGLDENLKMIAGSVAYLVAAGKQVFFDAEHYYDGYMADSAYALECLRAAIDAGASAVVLCDTNGGMLPHDAYDITANTVDKLSGYLASVDGPHNADDTHDANGAKNANSTNGTGAHAAGNGCMLGAHMHSDSGCAVANTLEAVRAGATMVQGTVNGYGERVGNANLLTVIANMQLHMGIQVLPPDKLKLLTPLSQFVAETFNVHLDAHMPYVGQAAFTHKGGLHVSATKRLPGAYEHVDPEAVGNFAHVVVSELAGRASLKTKAESLGIKLPNDAATNDILDGIKQREARGYSYEVADASLALLLRTELNEPVRYFTLESFRVLAEKRADGHVDTEATIKVHVQVANDTGDNDTEDNGAGDATTHDERFIATAEGNGPVNALDAALRKAISRFYPQINELKLTDYKVRVLDESRGTDAVTRVLIDTSDGHDSWSTMGVSENIIEASWDALVDSITYGLMRSARQPSCRS